VEDRRYIARAAVVALVGNRTLSQRFLDFETFDTEAPATTRPQAGALAWIDEETRHVPLALRSTRTKFDTRSGLTRHSASLAALRELARRLSG